MMCRIPKFRSICAELLLVFLLSSTLVHAAELWFPVEEQLVHKIYWGFIPVGNGVTTSRLIERDGVKYFQLRIRTKTNSFFDKIRRVDDEVESIVSCDSFLPVSFSRKMVRNRKVCNELTLFDYVKLEGKWRNLCSGEEKSFAIDKDTRDMLTFLYYMRQSRFKENSESDYRVMADEGMFDLKIRTKEKEDVDLPFYGAVSAVSMDPVFDFDGLLVDGGKFMLWVSDDDRCILIKAQIKRMLADIRVVLQQVSGGGSDFWAEKNKENGISSQMMTDEQIEQFLLGEEIQKDSSTPAD